MYDLADLQAFGHQMNAGYGLPYGLTNWVIGQESSWKVNAKNPNSSASGLGQFINSTANWFGIDRSDPYDSIGGTASYLYYLGQQYNGDWGKVLDAYGTTHNNPTKQAQAQALFGNDGRVLIGISPGGGTEVYAVGAAGDGGYAPGTGPGLNGGDGTGNGAIAAAGGIFDLLAQNIVLIVLGIILILGGFLIWSRQSR